MDGKERKLKLSKVRIKNFINFDYVELDFKNEDMFQFVGCNGSGKTSILEAIRRCTESKSNHSFSTIPQKDEMSFVVCTFEGNIGQRKSDTNQCCDEREQGTQDSGNSPKMRNTDTDKLVSIYISWHDNCRIRKVIKAIVYRQKNGISNEMVCTTQTESGEIKWVPYHKTIEKSVLEKMMQDNCDFKYFEKEIIGDNISFNMKSDKIENGGVEFDKMFYGFVKIEFLYPFRGISKIQSSEQMPDVTSKDHFQSGTDRSYILAKYLENETEYDMELEQKIFKRMTPDDDFSFHFTEELSAKLLEVKDNKACSAISVLKTPVGVLEAKYLSITLAKKRSGIVFIEEPGRGMHPDMIRRMIYLVFQDREVMSGKMVIITTHDKNFLTPFTIQNTFLCKKRNGRTREVKALAGMETGARKRRASSMEIGFQKELSVDEDKYHKRESVECRFLAAAVFSQRIMFLEGESDFILIETIKQLLITKEYLRETYLEALKYDYKDIPNTAGGEILQFLASLNVEMMNGVKNMRRIDDMCYYLGLQDKRYFLVDYDVLGAIDKTLSLDFTNLEWFNLQILESKGVFVWDNDVVESSSNGNHKEDKGVQCPGILKQDKVTGAGSPPKPGSLEDVIIRFSLQHDKEYHSGNGPCKIPDCHGLVKLLTEKKIALPKGWNSFAFTDDINILEVKVKGEIDVDETSSLVFTGLNIPKEGRMTVEKQIITGQIEIKGECKLKTCEMGDLNIYQRQTSEAEESWMPLLAICNGTAFTFSPDNHEYKIACRGNSRITIKSNKITKTKAVSKKGKATYDGPLDISVERVINEGETKKVSVKCIMPGNITIEEKSQCHQKLCMTEKFLLQNTLTHSDVLKVVEAFLKCSMEYRDGQIWRFLRFLADKALNRQTNISIKTEGGRFIQTVKVTDLSTK